jgi:hypothetical protein
MLVETRWKSQLDPVIACPLVNGQLLSGVALVSGYNTVNHGLGRKLQGYIVVLSGAAETFFDNQDNNASPQLTLILHSSGPTTVSLWVF